MKKEELTEAISEGIVGGFAKILFSIGISIIIFAILLFSIGWVQYNYFTSEQSKITMKNAVPAPQQPLLVEIVTPTTTISEPKCGEITIFDGILQVPPNKVFELNGGKPIPISNFCSDGSFPNQIYGCANNSWLNEKIFKTIHDLGAYQTTSKFIDYGSVEPCVQFDDRYSMYLSLYNFCEKGVNVSAKIIVGYCPTEFTIQDYVQNLYG